MRKLLGTEYNCMYMRFNTCTQDEQKQGYRCNITRKNCVGHVTLLIPYLDFRALQWDPIGLYAILKRDIVMRCPSRKLNEESRGNRK